MKAVNKTKNIVLAEKVVVASGLKKFIGLIGRKRLENGSGLLLLQCRGVHTYFMRFAIDVVYLDANGKVLKIVEGMLPYTLGPLVRKARAVLELPAGTCRESGTAEGDLVEFIKEEEGK
ncbi:MAG: DUF192 domain-containing protein [Thermosediminibacteraceae bacterium]|nr:DUF192 domain-containing protein [Thermosediminibacteraceae bacterium]